MGVGGAEAGPAFVGEGAPGPTSVLLRIGVGCVVAAIAPPKDVALRVMTRTHALLRHGWDEPRVLVLTTATAAVEASPRWPASAPHLIR